MSPIFNLLQTGPASAEVFETLLARPATSFELERIVSHGQATPAGEWYDQAWEEWVLLLQGQAELGWADGSRTRLGTGDSLLIEAHRRHRVEMTSPDCIWLAVHIGKSDS